MTIPNFLLSSFYFNQDSLITDVATIITSLRAILTITNNPVWTEPVTGTFKSPVDAGGRFMQIALSRTAQGRLEFKLLDQNSLVVLDREIDIDTTGTNINYFTGQYHIFIESMRTTIAQPEVAWATMLDPSPYGLNVPSNYACGNGYRNSGGAVDGSGSTPSAIFALDTGTPNVRDRLRAIGQTQTTSIGMVDLAGNLEFFPADIWMITGGVNNWGGKMYQTYIGDSSSIGGGVEKVLGLDDATLGTFRAINLAAGAIHQRFMVRIA